MVLIEKDGQVLLGRRSRNYGAKKWGLPQGFIEFDEDFITGAIREVIGHNWKEHLSIPAMPLQSSRDETS